MKRKSRFFIGLLAAALSFGTLMATIGPRHSQCVSKYHGKQKCEHIDEKMTEVSSAETN